MRTHKDNPIVKAHIHGSGYSGNVKDLKFLAVMPDMLKGIWLTEPENEKFTVVETIKTESNEKNNG